MESPTSEGLGEDSEGGFVLEYDVCAGTECTESGAVEVQSAKKSVSVMHSAVLFPLTVQVVRRRQPKCHQLWLDGSD